MADLRQAAGVLGHSIPKNCFHNPVDLSYALSRLQCFTGVDSVDNFYVQLNGILTPKAIGLLTAFLESSDLTPKDHELNKLSPGCLERWG